MENFSMNITNNNFNYDFASLNKADEATRDAKFREIGQEFEAHLVSQVMKQGLKSSQNLFDDKDGQDSGSRSYMDMANEQMAYYIGRHTNIGIADMMFNHLKEQALNKGTQA